MVTKSEIMNVLRERRSVRHFTDEELPKEQIVELLNDAAWAPSGGNDQPWAVTAITPDTARTLRERYERRSWNALVPKLASVLARASGRALTEDAAVSDALGLIANDAMTRGSPWLLLVHTADPPLPADWIATVHRELERAVPEKDYPTVDEMRETYGPVKDGVVFGSAICFAYALCLSAEARGLATCIQHSFLTFRDELSRDRSLVPEGRVLQTAVVVGHADPNDPVTLRARDRASRRPVSVTFL